jgi:hypothetical protein
MLVVAALTGTEFGTGVIVGLAVGGSAFGAAWDDAMVARRSANPLGMLWPEMDAAFVTLGWQGRRGLPATTRRPMAVVAGG